MYQANSKRVCKELLQVQSELSVRGGVPCIGDLAGVEGQWLDEDGDEGRGGRPVGGRAQRRRLQLLRGGTREGPGGQGRLQGRRAPQRSVDLAPPPPGRLPLLGHRGGGEPETGMPFP